MPWIEKVLLENGGRMVSANLGTALAADDSKRYRHVKRRYGGLQALLARFPARFQLRQNPPFNHIHATCTAGGEGSGDAAKTADMYHTSSRVNTMCGATIAAVDVAAKGSCGVPSGAQGGAQDCTGQGEYQSSASADRAQLAAQQSTSTQPEEAMSKLLTPAESMPVTVSSSATASATATATGSGTASSAAPVRGPATSTLPVAAAVAAASVASATPSASTAMPGPVAAGYASADAVVAMARQILAAKAGGALKAVELANMLRSALGAQAMAHVREYHGGLLSMLEQHSDTFLVHRVPKADRVMLMSADAPPAVVTQSQVVQPGNETV